MLEGMLLNVSEAMLTVSSKHNAVLRKAVTLQKGT